MKKSRRTYNGVHLNKKSNTQDVVEQSLTEYYYSLAKKECSNEFIKDLELLTEDFRKYQEDNQATVKVPDL